MISLYWTHIELLSGERPSADTCSVGLDDADGLSNELGRDPKPSANTSDGRGRGSHEWICPEIDIQHQSICAFDKDSFARGDSLVHIDNAIDHIRPQALCKSLASSFR